MELEGLRATLEQIPDWILILLAFAAGAVEATPVLGVLMPANSFVFLLGLQWATVGRLPVEIAAANALGAFAGDLLFFWAGRRFGLTFMERWPGLLRLSPERRAALERLFHAHGAKTVLIARFQPVTRSMAPYVAGAARLSAPRFLPGSLVASVALAAAFVFGGYLTGIGLAALGGALGGTVAGVVAGIVVVALLYYWLTHKLRLMSNTTLTLSLVGALAAGLFAGLLRDAWMRGGLMDLESSRWPAALGALRALELPAFVVAFLAGPGTILLAFLVGAAWLFARQRWREMYVALAAGPLLFGIAALLGSRLPRAAPGGPSQFPLHSGFPEPTAALAVALAATLLWIFLRPGQALWKRRLVGSVAVACALLAGAAPLVRGQAWPTETLGGFALGGAWVSAVLLVDTMAYRLLLPPVPGVPGSRAVAAAHSFWNRTVVFLDRHVAGNRRILWGLIAAGILLRLPGLFSWALGPDAFRYAAMAHGFLEHGALLMPWGDVYSPGTGLQPSHHYPPLFPMLLAGAYKLLGVTEAATRLVAFTLALAAVAVAYLCTRDLYGKTKALVAAAVVSLDPVLSMTSSKGYSENLLLITFIVAVWAILRSLERPVFIVVGAAFAGLGYLTKSSMGAFFVVAGLAGLAWRIHWRGWKALKDPAYLTAIGLFGALVAAWGWRNLSHFGTWQTSAHIESAYTHAARHPAEWASLLVYSVLVMGVLGYLLYMGVAAWLPHLRRIPKLADEHDSGLWLAFLLPLVLTVPIDAALWLYEGEFYLHNVRYVSFAIVPLTWLLLRNVRLDKAAWAAILASFAILVAGTLYYTLPNRPFVNDVADRFGPLVEDGESVTFVDWPDVYRFYFDLTQDGRREVTVRLATGDGARSVETDWALVQGSGAWIDRDRYRLEFEMAQGGESWTAWKRTA